MPFNLDKKLPTAFFAGPDTTSIAKRLLGKLLVVPVGRARVSGMIVEVEAYLGSDDRAAHSYGGRRTQRNEVMYGEPGHVYVFFVYGMYYQLNFVCGPVGHPHAILVRGVEPVEGIDMIRRRRGKMADRNLTSGPGKLAIAFGIDRTYNGESVTGKRIWLEEFKKIKPTEIKAGPRIGIDYAGDDAGKPLRFWIDRNPFVSRTPPPR